MIPGEHTHDNLRSVLVIPPVPRSSFLVVIHDVAPPFCNSLREIITVVRSLVGSRFACAVVPRWHGSDVSDDVGRLLEMIGDCDEYLLHGWTHRREHRPGLISLLTNRSDEFRGLLRDGIQDRIDRGRDELSHRFGVNVRGLVPPAWQLPVAAQDLSGLSWVMRFGSVESCNDPSCAWPLATWSFDWGRFSSVAWAGYALGSMRAAWFCSAIPCVVIHPADVARGWLPKIRRIIRQLLDDDRQPIICADLFADDGKC